MANLFTSQTPAVTDASDGSPGITTATMVRFAVAGTVTGIRFYATATVSGTYTVALYRPTAGDDGAATGELLASKTMGGAPTAGTWNSVAFDAGVSVLANTLYRAAVFSGAGRYVATVGFFTADLTNADITADANGEDPTGLGSMGNGTFAINAALTYPASGGTGACYFADVEFTPGGSGSVTPSSIALTARTGAPSSSADTVVMPDSILLAASAGGPAVTTPEPADDDDGGGWNGLLSVIKSARADHAQNIERERNPLDCPVHDWPLTRTARGLHCEFGGHVVTPRSF